MDLTIVQLSGLLVSAFFLYSAFTQYRKGVFRLRELALWVAVWGALAGLSIISATLFPLTDTKVFSYRAIDLVMVGSVIGLFAVTYFLYREVKIYKAKTRELVRQVALMGRDGKGKRG